MTRGVPIRRLRERSIDAHANLIHHMVYCYECKEARFIQTMCGEGKKLFSIDKVGTTKAESQKGEQDGT